MWNFICVFGILHKWVPIFPLGGYWRSVGQRRVLPGGNKKIKKQLPFQQRAAAGVNQEKGKENAGAIVSQFHLELWDIQDGHFFSPHSLHPGCFICFVFKAREQLKEGWHFSRNRHCLSTEVLFFLLCGDGLRRIWVDVVLLIIIILVSAKHSFMALQQKKGRKFSFYFHFLIFLISYTNMNSGDGKSEL